MKSFPSAPIRRIAQGGGLFTDGDWIETPFITGKGVRLIQTGNVGIGVYREQGFRYITQDSFTRLRCTEVKPDDLLISRLADPVGRCCLAPDLGTKMITSVDVAILRPRPGSADNRYLNYYMSSTRHLDAIAAMSRGGTRERVSRDQLGSVDVLTPPLRAQRAIADYLDRETARIDALIAAKRRMVELVLEQFNVARIDLVVDREKQVRQEAPSWLGSIPNQWQLRRLKFVAKMESGHTPDKKIDAYWIDCTIPWITLNDVSDLEATWRFVEPTNAVNERGLENSSAHVLPEDAVVLSRDATVGRSALLGRPMAVSQHFVAWVCESELMPEYLLNVIRGPMQRLFGSLTAGATIATIGMPDLNQLIVPIPPIEDQGRIICQIAAIEEHFTKTGDCIRKQIGLLQEKRQALITAAVSGQIEIPEAA
jgi:type I restriction enzyme S subunit